MSNKHFKQNLFAQLARIGKALSHGNRLEILEFLAQREHCVEELARISGLTVANTSQHLQQLRVVGLVNNKKRGLRVFYRLSGDDVLVLVKALRKVAENHLADVNHLINTYLSIKDHLGPIPAPIVLHRAKEGLVTVLDVRPSLEYAHGHLPGAINIPLNRLEEYVESIDKTKQIVAYCRGPHSALAFDAVKRLRDRGFNARRLKNGFPEWRIAGLPIEVSRIPKNFISKQLPIA